MVCATDNGGAGSTVAGSESQVQFNSGGASPPPPPSPSHRRPASSRFHTLHHRDHRERHRIFQRAFGWSTRSRQCAPYRIRRHGHLDRALIWQGPRRQRPWRLRPPRHISLGITGGGGGTWGTITGTLSNQTDLQNALDAKLSLASWYATTTDALTQGSSNRYYADALVQTYLGSIGKGFFFSTTSADAWDATNPAGPPPHLTIG